MRHTSLAESLIDLFLFLVLTEIEGGEIRAASTVASSCIAIGYQPRLVGDTFKKDLHDNSMFLFITNLSKVYEFWQ